MSRTTFAPFDPCDYLDNEEVIAEYLTAALEDPNPSVLLLAEANVAKVRAMTASNARPREHEQKAFHVSELPANVTNELGSAPIPTTAAKFNREFKRRGGETSREQPAMSNKPIRNTADYRAALKAIEPLMAAKANTPDGDRLGALVTLVETYERAHCPIDPSTRALTATA